MIAIAATMTLMVWRTRQLFVANTSSPPIVRYWSDRGMRPEGYAGMVKAT